MKCKVHPTYKGVRPPTTKKDCDCQEVYEQRFYGSFVDLSPKKKVERIPYEVGQTVLLQGTHPWAGHKGEIVSLDKLKGTQMIRPRVRLFDTCDHECYIMADGDARVLK